MHEMNEFERLVAGELRRDAGPVLPVDDLAVYESVSTRGRPRWSASVLRFTSYLAAGVIVALFGGFLLVGVVTQPPGDGIPAAPGGSASPEGTLSAKPTPAPTNGDPAELDPSPQTQEEHVNLKTPAATALAIGLLASPAAGQEEVPIDLMAPASVTGTSSFPVDESLGSREPGDGVLRGTGAYAVRDWEASDPRLTGRNTIRYAYNEYADAEVMIGAGTVTHETDGGSWTGTASYLTGAEISGTSTLVMEGEGAYEGLTAYVVIDEESGPVSFSAIIFPGEMPSNGDRPD